MTIAESTEGDKRSKGLRSWLYPLTDWVVLLIIILTSSLMFGLGLGIAKEIEAPPTNEFWIENLVSRQAPPSPATGETITPAQAPAAAVKAPPSGGAYVGSKTGTTYYLPWCGSANRIKEENKVWFSSKTEAEAAGYKSASNCKGI